MWVGIWLDLQFCLVLELGCHALHFPYLPHFLAALGSKSNAGILVVTALQEEWKEKSVCVVLCANDKTSAWSLLQANNHQSG